MKDNTSINIETLEKEYEVTLQQYQGALNNYINSLKQTQNYSQLKGRAWWGEIGLKQTNVKNITECENICKADSKCSGATFSSKTNYCWTRKGESLLSTAPNDYYAIILSQKDSLAKLQYYNNKLTNMSKEIMSELQRLRPNLNNKIKENNLKQNELQLYYINLEKQKKEIEKQAEEYKELENNYKNQDLYASKQNMILNMLVVLMSVILLITIKKIFFPESKVIGNIFMLLIFLIFLYLSSNLTNPSIFALWLVFIIIFILM
jgi:hypothetical protein